MKKFFSILLSIIFALCFLFTLLLSVVRFNFSYSVITDLASQILKPISYNSKTYYDDGLFHPEDKKVTLAQYEFDASALDSFDFSSIDFTSMDVSEIVNSILQEYDVAVDSEFIAEVLASPDVSEFVDKYANEVVEYMTGAKEELEINPDDIKKVMNKSIDMFEEHTGEVVDRSGLDEVVQASVEAALPELTATLDIAKEENAQTFEGLKKVNTLLSLKFYLLCLAVCVILALIILLIHRNVFVWFKYISIPAIVDGALIFICAVIAAAVLPSVLTQAFTEAKLPKGIFEAVWAYAAKILGQLKLYGCITTLCGVVLCVLGFTLGKKKLAADTPAESAVDAESN